MPHITGQTIITRFEAFAPPWLAEKGDPIGLAIGSLDKPVKKMMVTLDVRPEVVEEAIEKNVDLIFAHHPPIFRPLSTLQTDSPQTKMYADLLAYNIAVYAAHTNLDVVEGGMNEWLADKVGLTNTSVLSVTKQEAYQKVVIRTPREGKGAILDLLTQSLATNVHTSENESPQPEVTIEAEVLETAVYHMLPQLEKIGSSTSLSYQVFPLLHTSKKYGLGRVGDLSEPITLGEYIQTLASVFNVSGLRYVTDDSNKPIQRVAILGGDGGKFYPDAVKKGADVFITGDVYYHTAHDMLADGLSVVDPGHHIESICKPYLTELFHTFAAEHNWDIEIFASTLNTDPFQFYTKP